MAERLGRGLQSPVLRFESGRRLQDPPAATAAGGCLTRNTFVMDPPCTRGWRRATSAQRPDRKAYLSCSRRCSVTELRLYRRAPNHPALPAAQTNGNVCWPNLRVEIINHGVVTGILHCIWSNGMVMIAVTILGGNLRRGGLLRLAHRDGRGRGHP